MPASKTMLTGGSFQDSLGNPLANGTLKFHLSQDCLVSGVGTVCSGIDVIIQLDSTGNVASSASTPSAPNQYIWSNLVMTPQNNYYRVTGYTAQGQIAFGGNNQQVGSGATFNLDSWVPNTVISWFPTVGQSLLLEVNGTPTADQQVANFESLDSSITITDEGNGNINFQSAAGSGGFATTGVGGFISAGLPMTTIWGNSITSGIPGNSANQLHVWQFCLEATYTLSALSYNVQGAGAAGSHVNFGFYNAATEEKIFDSGALAVSATGTFVVTFAPVTLAGGVSYYMAQSTDNTAPSCDLLALGQNSVTAITLLSANGSVKVGSAANLTVGGIMPATLGMLTPDPYFDLAYVFWQV